LLFSASRVMDGERPLSPADSYGIDPETLDDERDDVHLDPESTFWRPMNDDPKTCLFDDISPKDLRAGNLSDCWLLSTFAAIAEHPNVIKLLFYPRRVVGDETYSISLFSFETQRRVSFDISDWFPAHPTIEGETKYISRSSLGELWPCLLEKAFAKYVGSYEGLEVGDPCFAMGAITGCLDWLGIDRQDNGQWQLMTYGLPENNQHTSGLYNDDVEGDKLDLHELMLLLQDLITFRQYLTIAWSPSDSPDKAISNSGIVQNQVYSVLDVQRNPCRSSFNLLQLRHPCGSGQWTGGWSYDDTVWVDNPEVAAALMPEDENDGSFWIPVEEFVVEFESLSICKCSLKGAESLISGDKECVVS